MKSMVYIIKITAAVQPVRRGKWVEYLLDFGEGTTEISKAEAETIKWEMLAELEEMHPDSYKVEAAVTWFPYYEMTPSSK